MYEVLSQKSLHARAAEGYKSTGATVDLFGDEDPLIVREAGAFWSELGVRAKISQELAAVAEEITSGALVWCRKDVERMITPCPPRPHVDKIIERLGEDTYFDEREKKGCEGEDAEAAVADPYDSSSDAEDEKADLALVDGDAAIVSAEDAPEVLERVYVAGTAVAEGGESPELPLALTATQSDEVHSIAISMSALQESIESLRAVGQFGAMHALEIELAKERKKQRAIIKMSPAFAATFRQRREIDEQESLRKRRLVAEQNRRELNAATMKTELERASQELKKREIEFQEYGNIAETRHAMETFTVGALGQGCTNAGGVHAKKNAGRCLTA